MTDVHLTLNVVVADGVDEPVEAAESVVIDYLSEVDREEIERIDLRFSSEVDHV